MTALMFEQGGRGSAGLGSATFSERLAPLVLLVDDEETNQTLISVILNKVGYRVRIVGNADQALEALAEIIPDLILLDISMPGMDGITLCRHLRTMPRFANVPIIFLTARDSESDIVQGLEAGGHDYVVKPFFLAELLARVRTHVRLYGALCEIERLHQLALDANPLTRLPGNNSINAAIRRAIDERMDVTMVYCDIDNFKAFNDKYGFARGDGLLQCVARILQDSLPKAEDKADVNVSDNDNGNDNDDGESFLGHIGGDDFFLMAPSADIEMLVAKSFARFDRQKLEFYDSEDRLAGCINTIDRRGHPQTFPLVTLSMAGVDLGRIPCRSALEVSSRCAEVKVAAKIQHGNSFLLERRQNHRASAADAAAEISSAPPTG